MRSSGRQSDTDESALRQAINHPKRLEALGFLARAESGASEEELSEALGLSIAAVGYHLKVLRAAELVTSLGDRGRSGRYAAVAGASLSSGT